MEDIILGVSLVVLGLIFLICGVGRSSLLVEKR